MSDFETYQSPFSWRYASAEMRGIWSEMNKRRIWRSIWTALAKVQSESGLVTAAQVQDLTKHQTEIDLPRALQIEAEIHHDLMAEVRTFAEQCPTGGGIIHLGATSMDIEDNADAIRLRQALQLTQARLAALLAVLAGLIEREADTPVIALTHLQPAEPTTLGYRLSSYAQDLLADLQTLAALGTQVRGKGFKGAVGTAASYIELLGAEQYPQFEERLSQELRLPFFAVSTQTYPRRQDYEIISALAGLGATLHKLAFDLRLLQSPPLGELSEPFGRSQVGSSAMPFKRNPIQSEKMDSLARSLAQMPAVAWGNAANSLLERTLDDSANRRTLLPEAFLIIDELLLTATRIFKGLQIQRSAIERNFNTYAPFAATERLLMVLGKAGADRQIMHEVLRENALIAWKAVQQGQPNPLVDLLSQDQRLLHYLPLEDIQNAMQTSGYLGIAPQRARQTASLIHTRLSELDVDNPMM